MFWPSRSTRSRPRAAARRIRAAPGPGFTCEPEEAPTLLGDVVICPAVANRNAPDHAGSYEDELALLVVHGLLHLLGMDHDDPDEAEAMEAREQELLARYHRPAEGSSRT